MVQPEALPPGRSAARPRGSILLFTVILVFIFGLVMVSLVSYALNVLRVVRSTANSELAFQIAEAGINYYEWHLAHYTSDFADGTGQTNCNPCGPYVHDYIDKDVNQKAGQFSLSIIPPTLGSTVVTIQSTGTTVTNAVGKRVLAVKYAIPSLAQYAFLTNSDAWIGDTESVSGQFHTNGGLRFDGTGNAPIYSAKSTYTCTPTFGCSPAVAKPGIWGSAPQSTKNFWQFPLPNVDFSTMTGDLAAMKSDAQVSGIYLPPSNEQGYSLVFKSDGTVDVYKVTALATGEPTGWDVNGLAHNGSLDYNTRVLQFNQALPANGVMFIEDKTWVEGTVKGRVMVAAARLPYNANTAPSILIPNNVVYAAKDGTNALGLLAQQDILVTYASPSTLEVDAALVAQNGSAERYYYPNNVKNSITVYGSTGSYGVWTWSWVNGSGTIVSGYTNTNSVYDANLLYAPPPSFPLSPSGYQQIYWQAN